MEGNQLHGKRNDKRKRKWNVAKKNKVKVRKIEMKMK